MTTKQENQIHLLRSEGKGYTAIANLLGLSVNTVKSYCRRNNLQGVRSGGNSNEAHAFCKQCGAELPQASGQKERKFCSDECRMKWWNSHQEQVERKAIYNFTCANCGKPFTAYGNAHRKYCSHACYIEDRFGHRSISISEGGDGYGQRAV